MKFIFLLLLVSLPLHVNCQWCTNAGTYDYYITNYGYTPTCDLGSSPAGTYRSLTYPRTPYAMNLPNSLANGYALWAQTAGLAAPPGTTVFVYQGMEPKYSQPYFMGKNSIGNTFYLWWFDNLWL